MNLKRFLTVAAMCGVVSFTLGYRSNISNSQDVRIYERIGSAIADIHINDTHELKSEYPPLASAVFFLVNSNIFDSPFADAWIWFLFLSIAGSMWYLKKKTMQENVILPPLAVLASALFLGPEVTFARYDVFIMLLLLLTWKAQEAKRYKNAATFLVLACGMKLVPMIGIPFLWVTTPKKDRRKFWKGILLGSLVAIAVPLATLGPSATWNNLAYLNSYHGERGVHIESTWSSVDMLHKKANTAFQAMSVSNTNLGKDLVPIAMLLIAAGLCFLWWRANAHHKQSPASFAPLLFIAFGWTLAASPVLSPQYMVWCIPLLIIYAVSKREPDDLKIGFLGLFIALATQWIFPMHYGDLVNQSSYAIVVLLFARNMALLIVAYLFWKELFPRHPLLEKLRSVVTWKQKKKPLTLIDSAVFLFGLCVLGGLYLQYVPHTQVVRYQFEGHESQTFSYAPMLNAESDTLHAKLYLHFSPIHPVTLRVKPDDCIRTLTVNGTPVPAKISQFCDYGSGRDLQLGAYLHAGTNLFDFTINDQGGVSGVTISASRYDRFLWTLYIGLFLLCYWYGQKVIAYHTKKKWPYGLWMIALWGMLLRFFYLLATPARARAYDLDGHVEYIKYIAQHFTIPDSQAGWEFHQAPIYYFLTGVWTSIAQIFGRGFDLILRDYQRFSFVFSAAALVACIPLAEKLFSQKKERQYSALFLGVLACFPALVYFAARITNGALYHLLAIITIVQLTLWWHERDTRGWYLTCLAAGLASIVKVSAYALFPAMFLCLLLQKGVSMRNKIRMGCMGALILVVVAGWFPLFRMITEADHTRSMQLGNNGMNSKLLLPSTRPSDLITFNPVRLVSIPFNNPWENESGRQYYLEYFFRAGFFGEFGYDGWRKSLGALILILGIVLMPVLLWGMYKENKTNRYEALPLFFSFFCLMASGIWYRINFPYGSNGDFRFIVPVIVPIAYFIVKGIEYLPPSVRKGAYKVTVALCGFCALFVISLYWQ